MSLSRRDFVGTLAATQMAHRNLLPTRVLGRTGTRVSILGMGGGSRFLQYSTDEKAIEAVHHALDCGIAYIDTAYGYGDGLSERRIGIVMATRRREVFLATKIADRDGDAAERGLESSLKRLQTDHLDLLQIHSLKHAEDLAAIEAPAGVLKRLLKLRDQKVVRAAGITSHTGAQVLKTAIERNDFDCVQMPLNAMKTSFESITLPAAVKKNMSVIAMKIFAAGGLSGQAPPGKLMHYSMSLPVAVCVVGMPDLESISENCRIARAFQPLAQDEMECISGTLSENNAEAFDYFLRHHADHYAVA